MFSISARVFTFGEAACFLKAVISRGWKQSEKWFQFHLDLLSREAANSEMSVPMQQKATSSFSRTSLFTFLRCPVNESDGQHKQPCPEGLQLSEHNETRAHVGTTQTPGRTLSAMFGACHAYADTSLITSLQLLVIPESQPVPPPMCRTRVWPSPLPCSSLSTITDGRTSAGCSH